MSQPLPAEATDGPVEGRHLRPGTLRDQWDSEPTLLVFLRHHGCPFTREWIAGLTRAVSRDSTFPPLLYVHLGDVTQGDEFFEQYAPEARAVADPAERLFRAFGLKRASWARLFGPSVIACGVRATLKGHGGGRPVGDPRVLPGLVLVARDRILWRHEAKHAGDLPDFAGVSAHAAAASGGV